MKKVVTMILNAFKRDPNSSTRPPVPMPPDLAAAKVAQAHARAQNDVAAERLHATLEELLNTQNTLAFRPVYLAGPSEK